MALDRTAYRAVITDFGGVLTSPLIESLDLFADELGIELQDLARAALGAYAGAEDSLVTDFEVGRIDEEEFTAAFASRLSRITREPVAPEDLVSRMFKLRLEESMFTAIRDLRRAGLKTGLLSNSWGKSLYPRERLEEVFDVIVLSYEVGLRKPDPAIFRLALERLAVAAGECLFVDDHPGHLQAAAEEGMDTILHISAAQTIAELEQRLSLRLT